jgi:hypothetical protein
MFEHLPRWPIWYWVLAIYTGSLSVVAARRNARRRAALRAVELSAKDDVERSFRRGERVGGTAGVGKWFVGGLLLIGGWNWARILVAIAYVQSARAGYRAFATGFAEGRKSAALASAPEYVRGRVPPRMPDFVAAALVVGVTRGLPFAGVVYAIARLPGRGVAWRALGIALAVVIGVGIAAAIAFIIWITVGSRAKKEEVGNGQDVRGLLDRLVSRGMNTASVVLRVRGRRGLALTVTKYLSNPESGRIFKRYSPESALQVVSTVIEPRGLSERFSALIRECEAGGMRLTVRRNRWGRRVLEVGHGRDVESVYELAARVFTKLFGADLSRDATATSRLLLEREIPHVTGVASLESPSGEIAPQPSHDAP